MHGAQQHSRTTGYSGAQCNKLAELHGATNRLMLSDAYTVFVFLAIESRSFFVLWIIDGDIQRDDIYRYRYRYIYT